MKPGTRVRIKEGWNGEGELGTLLAVVWVEQWWAVVLWDEEEDPDCFKFAGLEEANKNRLRRQK